MKTQAQHQCALCPVLQHGIMHDLKALHLDNSGWYSDVTSDLKKKQIQPKWVCRVILNDSQSFQDLISLKESQQNYLTTTEENSFFLNKSTFSNYFSLLGKWKPLMEQEFVYAESPERQTCTHACTHFRLKDCSDIPNPFEFFQPSGTARAQQGRGTFRQPPLTALN